MWELLDQTYGVDNINKIEDDLKARRREAERLKADVEAMEKIGRE